MFRFLTAMTVLMSSMTLWAGHGQQLKSGLQVNEAIQSSFQPLNINGPFAGRHHCLITEFRLKPVVLVFARMQAERVDPEVLRLLESLDKAVELNRGENGLESFAVFLSTSARSSATLDQAGDAKATIAETINREKLVNLLKEEAKPLKRLIVGCAPPESVAELYKLSEQADVTVLVYNRHRVHANFAFAEGQLNQAGIDAVLKSVDAMLGKVKKV